MDENKSLRQHLTNLLQMKGAHVDFDTAVRNFPFEYVGKKGPNFPYTAWQLLEHLRITQWDIRDFSQNPDYKEMEWPADYWPKSDNPADETAWNNSIAEFKKNSSEMQALVNDPATDLFAKIPHGTGQTILREALLVADHNAYHLGELVLLRKLLGIWK